MFVSKRIFLTKGVGRHREKLNSFEMALRDAGIALFNLVRVSSIFPPECKIIPKSQGLKYLRSGEVVFCVMSQAETNEPHRLCAASVGIAIPANPKQNGYLSEHHAFGQTEETAGRAPYRRKLPGFWRAGGSQGPPVPRGALPGLRALGRKRRAPR